MAADVANSLKSWSSTEGSNSPSGSTAVSTNMDDNLRMLQKVVRDAVASRGTVASATTCDIGAVDAGSIDVTGTTTISSFGTVSVGIRKTLTFAGALTLTHNATSLILPTGANITTAAGDTCEMESISAGWKCLWYQRASGLSVANSATFPDGSVSAPGGAFASDLDNGFYRIGSNNWALSAGGTKVADLAASAQSFGANAELLLNGSGAVTLAAMFAKNIIIGNASGSGVAGSVTIVGNASSNDAGGAVSVKGGNTASSSLAPGALTLSGGDSTGVGGVGANAIVRGGDASSGTGGNLLLQPGNNSGGTTKGYVGVTGFIRLIGNSTPTGLTNAGAGASINGGTSAAVVTIGAGASASFTYDVSGSPVSGSIGFGIAINTTTRAVGIASHAAGTVTVSFAIAPSNGEIVQVLLFGY